MSRWLSKLSKYRNAFLVIPVVGLIGCGSPEDKAKSHYESGMALVAKQDDIGARAEFLKALKYRTDKIEIWRGLAGVDERTKSNSLFLDLRRVVELDPNDLEARIKLVRLMLTGGAADAALKILDAGNDGDKPNAAMHSLRALLLLRTNDRTAAFREAQQAYDIDPSDVDAVSLLASKKLAERDADGALKLLNTLRPSAKDETRILLQKAQIHASKGDLAKSEEVLRAVISLNPNETGYQTQLVQLLIAQRRFDEAEKELRARVAANLADGKLGLELVRFLNRFKGPDVARAELVSRVKAGGDAFDYQMALAELDIAQNKVEEATSSLKALSTEASSQERKLIAKAKLAELYTSKSNFAAAEPIIADILSKERRNSVALKLRAAINIDRGLLDNAISDLRDALNDQPKSAELLVLMATAYERGGKNELADRQYADALRFSNYNFNVASSYVAYLQRQGDFGRAEDVLNDTVSRNPGDLRVLGSLGQLRLSRQNWAGAFEVAETAARLADGRVLADQIKAAAFAGQNKIDESIAALEDARKAAPDAVQPVVTLVNAYLKQEKPERALSLLQDLNKRYPNNAQVLVLLGQTKLAQKKDSEAVQNFKEAIAQQPKVTIGYRSLSDFHIRRKDLDSAGNVLQAALKELPDNLDLRLSSAGLQILKGDNEKAIAEYESVLTDYPNSLVAVNNLVSLILDHRTDKASLEKASSFENVLKTTSAPEFQDTLGWLRYREGNFKDAASILERVVEKLPSLAVAHYHLGMSYAAIGQSEKAAQQLKIALNLEPDGTSLKDNIRAALK